MKAYKYRPTYNQETIELIVGLLEAGETKRVLDAGCGTGFVARALVSYVTQIDAVDFSREAIEEGQRLPQGDNPRLRWLHSPMEEATLVPPYDLITAGASLHWMDWPVVMNIFHANLKPGSYLALIETIIQPVPWGEATKPLLTRYSLNKDFQSYDNLTIVRELEKMNLFEMKGMKESSSTVFHQPVNEYVESFHARNGLSRDRMSEYEATEFDRQYNNIVSSYCPDGIVSLNVSGRVIWGVPQS